MITKFDTSTVNTGGSKGGSNTLIWVLLIGAGLYLGYRYVVKPMMEKEKEEK